MAENSQVILYGNSVFLAGIKAQLEHICGLGLITMEAAQTDLAGEIRAYRPRALLFDLTMGYPDFAVALLHERPGLLLIGVSPNSNELLLLSGQQERAVSLADLLKVIQREEMEGRRRGDADTSRPGDPETR